MADLQPGRVVTLCGPGGIGKSALAAEAVWTLASGDEPPPIFPDGIIFHSFYNQPQATLALESIARAFGEEPKPTARDAAQRVLANRRVLLLLDGTEDADNLPAVLEVRAGCGVLVTSRQRQDAVAERQDLKPLPPDEAVHLLRAWGQKQVGEPVVAYQICELVGRLPLAVRLVGRYLEQTEEPAAGYLEWLRETPIAALSHGQHREQSVAVLLERSLRRVSPAAQKMLAVVGLLALAPFSLTPVQAVMSETPLRQPLNELLGYGLLQRSGGDRCEVSHALIHTYARQRTGPAVETVSRLAAYYEAFGREQREKGLAGYALLDGERNHTMRVLANCTEHEAWEAARRLVWTVEDYLDIRGYSTERVITLEIGVKAARELGNRYDEGAFVGNLGLAYRDLGQVEQAIEYHQQALVIDREIGYRQGEASALGNLGLAYSDLGQVERAKQYLQQSLVIFEDIKAPQAGPVREWLNALENG